MKRLCLALSVFGAVSCILAMLFLGTVGCAQNPPPTLTPAASIAFNNLRIQNVLDQIRDIAQAANAATPPVLSTATTRKVTVWHNSTIKVIHAAGPGWYQAVLLSLDELTKDLPPADVQLLTPYVEFAKGIIKGVS